MKPAARGEFMHGQQLPYEKEPDGTKGFSDCAATFDEIGAALGTNKKAAYMLYKSAMAKIRRRPHAVAALKDAIALSQQVRGARGFKTIRAEEF